MAAGPAVSDGALRAAGRKIELAQQIEEIEREQRMRARVYPNMIASGKLRPAEADEANARLEGVLATLRFCQEHEHAIREYIKARKAEA